MKRTLLVRSLLDSWLLLMGCSAVLIGFLAFRVWIVGKMDFSKFEIFFATGLPEFIRNLLPVPFEVLATPAGRLAFGFEEAPTVVMTALWGFSRGSECLAGRLGEGTMEMLLAQPVRRITIVATHSAVTLLGCVVLGMASWLGTGLGIAVTDFKPTPAWRVFVPASFMLAGLAVFCTGLATLFSALSRSRGQAVGIAIGFYVVQLTLLIVSRLTPQYEWIQWTTFLSAYDPTALTVGIVMEPSETWPVYWASLGFMSGMGVILLTMATTLFCRRDVPAPL